MSAKTIFHWEQDGSGGEHGTATYFPGEMHEATVALASFTEAHQLQARIESAIACARRDARGELLLQIARILP